MLWYCRLGYIGLPLLKKTAKITTGLSKFDLISDRDFFYAKCAISKAVRQIVTPLVADLAVALAVIVGDLVIIKPLLHSRMPYLLILIDQKTYYRWVYLLKDKSAPTIHSTIKGCFRGFNNYYNRYLAHFHFDSGIKVDNSFIGDWLGAKGIGFSTFSPYIYEQNGLVEYFIRVILDRLRTTLQASSLPLYLWCYIIAPIVDLVNYTAVTNKDLTPYQLLWDELEPAIVPYMSLLKRYKIIGSRCLVTIPHKQRVKAYKLVERAKLGRIIAILSAKTYLVYILKKHAIQQTATIKLLELAILALQPPIFSNPTTASTTNLPLKLSPKTAEDYSSLEGVLDCLEDLDNKELTADDPFQCYIPPSTTPSAGVNDPSIEATAEGDLTTILEGLQGISAD